MERASVSLNTENAWKVSHEQRYHSQHWSQVRPLLFLFLKTRRTWPRLQGSVIVLPWARSSCGRLHFNRASERHARIALAGRKLERMREMDDRTWRARGSRSGKRHSGKTRQNTQNARSTRRRSRGEYNGYLYYRDRESPRRNDAVRGPGEAPTTMATASLGPRLGAQLVPLAALLSYRPPQRHKYWWKRCVYTPKTSPSAIKKPRDLSGRGFPTTAISDRVVHQAKSGSRISGFHAYSKCIHRVSSVDLAGLAAGPTIRFLFFRFYSLT
jgi:hypothetical protein